MRGRILKKPCYGLAEICERWVVTEQDVSNFVAADELTLSVVVASLAVEKGSIEDVDERDWFYVPEERCYLSGAVDLHHSHAWSALVNGSETISSFKAEPGRYISIADRGDEPGTLVVLRERLVVRHAERLRFEAAQEAGSASAGSGAAQISQPAARGAAPRYDWDAFWAETLVSMFHDGPPATLAEYVRRMEAWFADRGEHPDPSTIKKKLSPPWRRIASQLERRRA